MGGRCAAGFPFYPCNQGYLSGSGYCFVAHAEVEELLKGRRRFGPKVEKVNMMSVIELEINLFGGPVRVVTPPPSPRDHPFNWPWRRRRQQGWEPMPKNSDGGEFCPVVKGYHEGECQCDW